MLEETWHGVQFMQRRRSAIYEERINEARWTALESFPSLNSFQNEDVVLNTSVIILSFIIF